MIAGAICRRCGVSFWTTEAITRHELQCSRTNTRYEGTADRGAYPEPPTDPALETECEGCS